MAMANANPVSIPRNLIPANDDRAKIIKPKNKIREVYRMGRVISARLILIAMVALCVLRMVR